MAEVCTQTQHNILTPRGAQVRDALLWSRTIDEAQQMFGDHADVLMNCHNWPVWGRDALNTFLEEQRDIYKYIHDQTLRLANLGHTPDEDADLIEEPAWLSQSFMRAAIMAIWPLTHGLFISSIMAFLMATLSI